METKEVKVKTKKWKNMYFQTFEEADRKRHEFLSVNVEAKVKRQQDRFVVKYITS